MHKSHLDHTFEEHEHIALAMSKAKKQYTSAVFANAGHGFLSDRRDNHQPAAAQEARDMTLNFFKRHFDLALILDA